MKRFNVFFIIVALAPFAYIWHPFVSAEISNRVVAFVNNDIITLHELNNKIRELTGVEPAALRNQDEKKYLETRLKILNLLVEEKITREKIHELNIRVTPSEVDAAIERIKKQNNITHESLLATLKSEGMTYKAYKKSIKNQIERMQLINSEVKSKIIIRNEELQKYYNEHEDKFCTEEKAHIAAIFLKRKDTTNQEVTDSLRQKAKEIISRLKNGENFAELAKEYSQGPGAEEGGDIGFFKISDLDPNLRRIIKNMSAGDISEPIIGPSAIQIIKLREKQEKGVKPLEEVKDTIYRTLYLEEVNKRYSSWIKELREKAYTKVTF